MIVAIITARDSAVVKRRAAELRIEHLAQAAGNKAEALRTILEKTGISAEGAAFIGDDLQDIPAMQLVRLPIAVANARPEVKAVAAHVTNRSGGQGAVREAVEWILDMRGERESAIKSFIELAGGT